MRLLSLKEIAAMEPGEVVPAFKCQVKEVREPKSGDNQYGPWTMQTLTVMDATAVAQVKLFDAPVYDAQWVGLWIIIESSLNDKGKLSGIQVSEYNKRKEIQVKFKQGATISQVTDETPEPAQPEPPKPAPVKPAAQPVRAPEPAKTAPMPVQGANKGDSVALAKQKLGQQVNAMKLSYDAALYLANEVLKAHPEVTVPMFTPDILQKIAVSFSIALDRSGLVMGLPAGPMQKAKAPEPPPPEPEQEIPYEF